MQNHWHASIDNVVFITVASIVGWNVIRLGAAWMVKRGGSLETAGSAIGALVK